MLFVSMVAAAVLAVIVVQFTAVLFAKPFSVEQDYYGLNSDYSVRLRLDQTGNFS